MSLNPSLSTAGTIRSSIQNALKLDLPPGVLANMIAPLLVPINQWSTQIPAVLEGSGTSSAANAANLVFAIRKDLFVSPSFSQSVMGQALVDLPGPFRDFMNFIHQLIEVQKTEREKPIAKVYL